MQKNRKKHKIKDEKDEACVKRKVEVRFHEEDCCKTEGCRRTPEDYELWCCEQCARTKGQIHALNCDRKQDWKEHEWYYDYQQRRYRMVMKDNEITCFNCQGKGHKARDCQDRSQGWRNYPWWNKW